MCSACRTPDGKIIGGGVNFEDIGTHKDTAELLTRCIKCGGYYVSDAFSPHSEAVSEEWVQQHINAFKPYRKSQS